MSTAAIPQSGFVPKSISQQAPNFWLRFFPSLTDIAFLLPIAILFKIGSAARNLLSDGDTGWHIRTGEWILQHKSVPHHDLFSFSMAGAPWFAWEWTWDVVVALVHRFGGLSGVVLCNAVLIGLISALLFRLVRKHAANDLLALVITVLAMCGSTIHWLARPHLASWLFFVLFLHIIDAAFAGERNLIWWSLPLTLAWANTHGSFFLGPCLLLTYGIFERVNRKLFLSYSMTCLAISLINPYGWHLHQHVIEYLCDSKQLRDIIEFQSPNFHSPSMLLEEVFLFLAIAASARAIRSRELGKSLVLLLFAHLSLKFVRNVPLFLFLSAAPVASLISSALRTLSVSSSKASRKLAEKALAIGQEFRSMERVERLPLCGLITVLVCCASLGIIGPHARVYDFDGRDFPVAAVKTIESFSKHRVFTFDQWGDYLAYHFYPQREAFLDGRSDFYGNDFEDLGQKAQLAHSGWEKTLAKYSIDTVLLKPSSSLAAVLKLSPAWQVVFDDGSAIVFRKRGGAL
jgi:hypothetical protein